MSDVTYPRDRTAFVQTFGRIYEHSPWVAEAAYNAGLRPGRYTPQELAQAMAAAVAKASEAQKRALLEAHPDLAGRLAAAEQLTAESTSEQANAGLDRLTGEELRRFTALNDAYRAKFGFPFIMAVKGRTKDEIVAAFGRRLNNDAAAEMATALAEIDRIALLRLSDLLPD